MRINIVLRNKETGEEYLTSKNRRNNPDRIKLMKYSPKLHKRVIFEEKKN
ncbi:50S ribosomal protein L33 [Lentilactobacillus curieae]|uniref:Large ribosomal subunit protein bL33 n=1 Tax=Lentilactobacillus curieae TaxID=1138822 RepID=A0A1S6QHF1_9LACO|nr:50S ribosomal protein L33 [Lentilactobacillus curieae]AQW21046.1 50S ribosomal protein L33 [Lentilactobacillus curieae]